MKLVLVGFMGSGKSTVGRLLSRKLSLPFVDLDSLIVERTGMSIPQIFREKGEGYFREIEREILISELSSSRNLILSTGGGAPAYRDNMNLINRFSTSIFLHASFETLFSRISGDRNRPLASLDRERLKNLFLKRLPFYRKAHITINTEGKTPADVVNEVVSTLNGGKGKPTPEGQENQTW